MINKFYFLRKAKASLHTPLVRSFRLPGEYNIYDLSKQSIHVVSSQQKLHVCNVSSQINLFIGGLLHIKQFSFFIFSFFDQWVLLNASRRISLSSLSSIELQIYSATESEFNILRYIQPLLFYTTPFTALYSYCSCCKGF